MEKIVSLARRRGFIFPSSEIYGGLSGCWDYGPLGAELKRNIKNEFWINMTRGHESIVGLDAAIIMNPKVWEASGHVENFTDPLVDCKKCKTRFRADQIPEDKLASKVCPDCGGELTDTRKEIESKIRELERSDISRLMKVKEMLDAAQRARMGR